MKLLCCCISPKGRNWNPEEVVSEEFHESGIALGGKGSSHRSALIVIILMGESIYNQNGDEIFTRMDEVWTFWVLRGIFNDFRQKNQVFLLIIICVLVYLQRE